MTHKADWPVTEFDIVAGYDLHDYAPPPHGEIIAGMAAFIEERLPLISDKKVDDFIKQRAPDSPLTGDMFLRAADEYRINNAGLRLMMALCQQDSMYGTKGEGTWFHNPGNVGDDAEGHTRDYGTWEAGVDAVAEWLSRHRVPA